MYRVRHGLTTPPIELEQGDILVGLPRPGLPMAKSIAFFPNRNQMTWPRPDDALAKKSPQLRVVVPIQWLDFALVVSNSCDNVAEQAIEIAPIRAYKFSPKATDDAERWKDISHAATSTATPKLLYLPGDDNFGLSRSEAMLGDKFPVSFEYLMLCAAEAGTARLCGLTKDAQIHLQWQLGVSYGRNDREDLEWPSPDDLKLKRAWLQRELGDVKRKAFHDRYQRELAAVDAVLGPPTNGNDNGHGIEVEEAGSGPQLIDVEPVRPAAAAPTPAAATAERATAPGEPDDPSEGSGES